MAMTVTWEELLQVPPCSFTPSLLEHFTNSFITRNYSVQNIDSCQISTFQLRTLNLIGIHKLWEIVLQAPAESLFLSSAIQFLCELYLGKSKSLGPVYTQFISTIMFKLNTLSSSSSSALPSSNLTIHEQMERCVNIMTEFVKATYSSGSVSLILIGDLGKCDIVLPRSQPIKVLRDHLFQLLVSQGQTSKQLLKADYIQLQFVDFPLLSSSDYELTFGELEIPDRSVLTYSVMENEIPTITTRKITKFTVVASYLSNDDDFFQQLFNLFDVDRNLSESVWNLLSIIPTNRLYSQFFAEWNEQVKTNEEWVLLLPTKSPFKLLYSLRVITSVLENLGNDIAKNQSIEQWQFAFLKSQAFNFLVNLLLNSLHDMFDDDLTKRTLQSLLKFFHLFLLNPTNRQFKAQMNSFPQLNDILDQSFISRLLQLISHYADSSKSKIDNQIVNHSIDLMVSSCLFNPNLVSFLRSNSDFRHIIRLVSLNEDKSIREHFNSLYLQFHKSDTSFFFHIYLDLLKSVNESPQSCEQFFNCLATLFLICDDDQLGTAINFNELFEQIAEQIQHHIMTETDLIDDFVYIGLSTVLSSLIESRLLVVDEGSLAISKRLINFLFSSLFELPSEDNFMQKTIPPQCKNKQSRIATFRLLQSLSSFHESNHHDLFTLIHQRHLINPVEYNRHAGEKLLKKIVIIA